MTDEGDGSDRRDEPLANLAAEVEVRRGHDRATYDAFTEENVGDIDLDNPWNDLLAEDSGELVVSAPREESEDNRDVRTIPKSICHSCPHFGEPPTLRCAHGGTDIMAVVDTKNLRVADCPMVVDKVDPLDG